MFKLESYITPWLMGYLDRYVKLRPEDLQISLWGGDAMLYNLDLRLDVLEKAMQLPITFKSGHIHELRLHVPWTKLGSEPILITINTVECILKVRDTAYEDSSSSVSSSSAASSSKLRRKIKRQPTEELPPGYLQSILNRIVNNVTFIINNLILKFVEDDIVLSVNVKSAESYSCDIDWKRAFVDVSPQDLVLRKVINFSDLTVCLDKSSADGRIENYQEPMLYRCFIMCRLHLTYDSVNAKMPTVTRLNIFCEKLDWLITDTQLPMFHRLIELCLALYYGYLDLPSGPKTGDGQAQHLLDKAQESSVDVEERTDGGGDAENQGWAAWMWSMVPQILPEGEEEELYVTSTPVRVPILSLGFYIQQATITFKLTEHIQETSSKLSGCKLVFHPFLVLGTSGLAAEVLMQGATFFSVQCGVSNFTLTSEGPCICGYRDPQGLQSSVIFTGGKSSASELAFDSCSLFDPLSYENCGDQARFVLSSEDHFQKYTESYGLQRFGSFWMDYMSSLVLPDTGHSSSQSSDTDSADSTLFQQENTTFRFLFGPSHFHVNSSAVHRIHKFLCCAWNHHYEPYKNLKPREERAERVLLTETQIKELEEFIPTCSYHLTLLQPQITVSAAHHPHCNVQSKIYSAHHAKNKRGAEGIQAGEDVMDTCLSAERFDLQLLKPMYPGRLARLVSNIVGPSSNLLHHCHSHTQLKVFSLQAGLKRASQKGRTWQPVVVLPSCSMAAYFRSLMMPEIWKNSFLATWEHSYELLQVSVTVSKASLAAMVHIISSWTQPLSAPSAHALGTLLTDLFPDFDESRVSLPVVELSLSGLALRSCHTPLVQAYTGSLSSLQILLYLPGSCSKKANTVPLLYGPVDTCHVSDRAKFQCSPVDCLVNSVECVAFTLQKPHHTGIAEAPSVLLVTVEGMAGCLDPILLQWFAYAPRPKLPHTPADLPSATVDVPLAEATSPLQVSGSRMSIRSSSSQTQPTTKLFSHSHTQSHTRCQSAADDGTGGSAGGQDSSAANSLSSLLVRIFPHLRMMQVQVDIKASCMFLPSTPLLLREGCVDIAANIQSLWREGTVEEVLVVCLPAISIHSAAASRMATLQDIPITLVDGSLLSEKFPWVLQLKQLTAFTLHKDRQCWPLLEGMSVTSTFGATVQYNPPTSDNIQSIALCVHLDITPLLLALNGSQLVLAGRLAGVMREVISSILQLAYSVYTKFVQQPAQSQEASAPEHDSAGVQHTEVSVTGGSPDGVDIGTTDLSEDASHEPLHHIVTSALSDTHSVKLSVWLQCVLPRLTATIVITPDPERQIQVVMEDLALSCDVQQVYLKVNSKLGSISIKNYIQKVNGNVELNEEGPVIVSTSKELPHDLHVVSSKSWSIDRQHTNSLFPLQENYGGEKVHGFFSLTYTQALCRNVRKKMKRMNVDLTSLVDKEEPQHVHGLFFHKFVSELCIKMEPVDIVLHYPTFERIVNLFIPSTPGDKPHAPRLKLEKRETQAAAVDTGQVSTFMTATHTTPLVYADMGTVRLFIPLSSPQVGQEVRSALTHDLVLLQIDAFHVQPYADNPLPRYPVERELFLQAFQSEMHHQTGSCVEDRQYQLQMKALSVSSGRWDDIIQVWRQRKRNEGHLPPVSPGAQNPALEWNTYLGQGHNVQEVELIPMTAAFDLCIVVAPPIVYDNSVEGQSKLVCGVTAELNVLSDLELHLSTHQLNLLSTLMTCVNTLTSDVASSNSRHTATAAQGAHGICDSGIESDLSSITRQEGWSVHCGKHRVQVPFDVLLTAGRISLTLYSHTYQVLDTADHHQSLTVSDTSSAPPGKEKNPMIPGKAYVRDNIQLTHGMRGVLEEEEDQCVAFSFIQPHIDDLGHQPGPSTGVFVQPFLYIYIAQPHTVISCWPDNDKVELSCYDILVKGARSAQYFPVAEHQLIPDHADFDVYWVETRAGQPNAKTGIPPSLLTLRLTNLLSLPAGLEVKIERPVKVSLGENTMQQVTTFLQHLHTMGSSQHQTSRAAPETLPDHPKSVADAHGADSQHCHLESDVNKDILQIVEKVTVHTEQIVVSYETVKECTAGLLASVGSISLDINVQQRKPGNLLEAHGGMCCKDLLMKTLYNKGQHLLAGPITFEADAVLRWPNPGQASVPQLILSVQAGLVLLSVGQETALCLNTLAESLQSGKQHSYPAHEQKSNTKPVPTAGYHGLPQITIHSQSHDDIRAGPFKYIQNDSTKEWPDLWEIIFSQGEAELGIDSTMTWAYPEPRLITAITTLPVPFSSYLAVDTSQHVTVPCQLQWWDDRLQDFVPYAHFELSESESSTVKLPEVKATNISSLAVSHMWRVVLCQVQQVDVNTSATFVSPETTSRGRGECVVLATTLAASVCVDSCCVPDIVPALQVSISLASLQLQLCNHLAYNGKGIPDKLHPFTMSQALPADQQWAVVSLDNLGFLSSHIVGLHHRSSVEMLGQGQVEVLDFSSLTLLPVVDPVDMQINMSVLHHYQPSLVETQIRTGQLHVHFGRSAMHTINNSLLAWNTFGAGNDGDAVIFSHLIICNNTQETLRFGQVGTDENMALQSGHMLPYSWHSYQSKQLLHFCLDQPTWRWCSPISVDKDGDTVRVVRARDQHYTLIIKTVHLNSVCRQVSVSGQLVVGSRLSLPLEVHLVQHGYDSEADVQKPSLMLEAGKILPSFVAEHEDVAGVSLRLAGHHLPWSNTIYVGGQDMRDNQLLKLILPDGSSFFHIWCRIFCKAFGDARQKVMLLSPLYVLRSHLPRPLHVTLETGRLKQCQELEVLGRGHEYQLHCIGGDISHHVSFRLGIDLPRSSPPVILSGGLIDQVRQADDASIDLDSLWEDVTNTDLSVSWPYTDLQSSNEHDMWTGMEQTSVDLNIHLSQYIAGCRTLLVDIAPWCLLTNATPLPLIVLARGRQLHLPSGSTIAPPAFQELQLGFEHGGQLECIPPIPLSDDDVENHRYSPERGRVLFLDSSVQVQLLLLPISSKGLKQVVPLCVASAVVHGMRVITVSAQLLISNVSGLPLQARFMAVPQQHIKLAASHLHVATTDIAPSSSDSASPILHWHLLGRSSTEDNEDHVLYMSFKLSKDPDTAEMESSCSSVWSVPVRVVHSSDGARLTVSVPTQRDSVACTVALCVTCQLQGAQTYIVVSQDTAPFCVLHNHCPFAISYGQAVSSIISQGSVVQEETELLEAVPNVPSGGWAHYTMPHINAHFPSLDTSPVPRLHVCALIPIPEPGTKGLKCTQPAAKPSVWSAGIDLNVGDTFLQIADVTNIKVNIKQVSNVRHVVLSVLNKAEISAKEIRSRIRGSEDVTITTGLIDAAKSSDSEVTGEKSVMVTHSHKLDLEAGSHPLLKQLTVGVLFAGVHITLHDDITKPDVITELLQVQLDHVLVACYPVLGRGGSTCVAVCVGDIQVDNPLTQHGQYDFPVVLRPQKPVQPVSEEIVTGLGVIELHAVLRAPSAFHLQLVMGTQPAYGVGLFFDSVEMALKPMSAYVEDTYFHHLMEEFGCCLQTSLSFSRTHLSKTSSQVPCAVLGRAHVHQNPLRIGRLCLQPASLLLSVHASVKLFLATDHAPLAFRCFERHNLFTCTQQLAYTMALHYITSAVFRAGMVVGAMDILGSPTGLVRSVSAGVSDLVRLPYYGLTNSPKAFVTGIFGGINSLLRNTTAGMVTSVTNFASSLSRNMDRLSLDTDHRQRQDETRRQRPTGISSGLQQGLTGFGLSLLGAVAGLVDQPLQTVVVQQSAGHRGSAARAAGSLLAGVGKGLVGIITKPIGGAAELVSQTGQGLLQGTGLGQRLEPRRATINIQHTALNTGWLKYPMKLLLDTELLLAVKATQEDLLGGEAPVVLLLTRDMIVVISCEDDAQQQAFALSQLHCSRPAPAILMLCVADTVLHTMTQMDHANKERVAAFINSASVVAEPLTGDGCPGSVSSATLSQPSHAQSGLDSPPDLVHVSTANQHNLTLTTFTPSMELIQQKAHSDTSFCHEFRMEPHWCQVFISMFTLVQNNQKGRGFPNIL